jgi:hypothetical protein
MNHTDLDEMLAEERFTPFVITMTDGFALAIGPEERKHVLVGRRQLVVMDSFRHIIHIPYRSIAHVREKNDEAQ